MFEIEVENIFESTLLMFFMDRRMGLVVWSSFVNSSNLFNFLDNV